MKILSGEGEEYIELIRRERGWEFWGSDRHGLIIGLT
jgi:hypothetical protein